MPRSGLHIHSRKLSRHLRVAFVYCGAMYEASNLERAMAFRAADGRPSAHQRGYGVAWRAIRVKHLASKPWCRPCGREGRRTRATDVDHKTPKAEGGTDHSTNLQSLCHSHHSSKTRMDNAA